MNFLVNHMATMTAMMMQQNNRRHREEEERRKKRQEESQKSKAITSKAYKPKHAKKEDLTEEEINLMSI